VQPLTDKPRPVGNIAPYRNALLKRIGHNWRIQEINRFIGMELVMTVMHDGSVEAVEIFRSSGNPALDQKVIAAVKHTKVDPLPDWYRGEQLQFKISMGKVADLMQEQDAMTPRTNDAKHH
jgi:TonB family protein